MAFLSRGSLSARCGAYSTAGTQKMLVSITLSRTCGSFVLPFILSVPPFTVALNTNSGASAFMESTIGLLNKNQCTTEITDRPSRSTRACVLLGQQRAFFFFFNRLFFYSSFGFTAKLIRTYRVHTYPLHPEPPRLSTSQPPKWCIYYS